MRARSEKNLCGREVRSAEGLLCLVLGFLFWLHLRGGFSFHLFSYCRNIIKLRGFCLFFVFFTVRCVTWECQDKHRHRALPQSKPPSNFTLLPKGNDFFKLLIFKSLIPYTFIIFTFSLPSLPRSTPPYIPTQHLTFFLNLSRLICVTQIFLDVIYWSVVDLLVTALRENCLSPSS